MIHGKFYFQVKRQNLNGKIGINFNVNLKLNVNRLNFEKYFLKTL